MKLHRVAIVVLVLWDVICAASIIYYPSHSLLIVILNMTALWLCWCILRLRGLKADDKAMVMLAALYGGFMNGATLGLIISIIGNIITGRYVPVSVTVACCILVGIILAILFPRVMSRIPSF
jgi:hypothetical protein